MKDSLAKLLELQTLDSETDALRRSQEDYPQEISRLKAKTEAARSKVDEKRNRVAELEARRYRGSASSVPGRRSL